MKCNAFGKKIIQIFYKERKFNTAGNLKALKFTGGLFIPQILIILHKNLCITSLNSSHVKLLHHIKVIEKFYLFLQKRKPCKRSMVGFKQNI